MTEPKHTEKVTGANVDAEEPARNTPATDNANELAGGGADTGDPEDGSANEGVATLHQFLENMNDGDENARKAKLKELEDMLNGSFRDHVNTKGYYGRTALHFAATQGLVEAANRLIKAGAEVNARDNDGDTPLDDACREGHEGIVSLLLREHAKTDNFNDGGRSTLYTATENGHVKIVEALLLKDKSTMDSTQLKYQWTPLHIAINSGHEAMVDTLLRSRANRDVVDIDNWTPLMLATRNREESMVSKLLEPSRTQQCHHLEIKDHEGNTPLMWAVTDDFSAGANLLIDAGADCNTRSSTGETPIIAISSIGNQEIVSALLKQKKSPKVDINAQRKDGQTALHCAILRDHTKVVQLLLKETGIKVMIQDNDGGSALHLASLQGNEAMLKLLLETEAGQYLDVLNKQDKTPIQVAIDASDFDKDGLSDDVMPDDLDAAKMRGLDLQPGRQSAVIRLLLERGARLEITEQSGKELLSLAAETRDPGLMESVVKRMDLKHWKDLLTSSLNTVHSEEGSRDLPALLVWAAGDYKRHYAAKLLIIKAYKAESKSKSPRFQDWGAIEWAVWAELPKELWALLANSPRNMITMESVKRAGEWINTGMEMKRSGVQEELKDIIEDPPIALMQVWKDSQTLRLPTFDEDRLFDDEQDFGQGRQFGFLEDFKAALIQFYEGPTKFASIRRDRAVRKVIYEEDSRIDAIMEKARNDVKLYVRDFTGTDHGTGQTEASIYEKSESRPTWVHLPFTNMLWMEDLLQRIMYDEGYSPHQFLHVKSFLRNSWVEVPDRTSESRIMRPRFLMTSSVKHADDEENDTDQKGNKTPREATTDDNRKAEWVEGGDMIHKGLDLKDQGQVRPTEQTKERERQHALAAASADTCMPYLSYSMYYHKRDNVRNDDHSNGNAKEHSRPPTQDPTNQEGAAAQKYDDDRMNHARLLKCYRKHAIHGPSTLDEWYYHFPLDSNSQKDRNRRNETQVLTEEVLGGNVDYSRPWPLVRVNQLWLWTIDKKWVITASPPSATDTSKDILLDGILNHLGKQREVAGQPNSTDEMSKLIVDYCIGSYERRPSSQGQRIPHAKDLSIRQAFSNSINAIGRDETKLFDEFRSQSARWRQKLGPQVDQDNNDTGTSGTSAYEEELRQSVKEAERLSANIKDIRDELNILEAVVQYQRDVQESMYWGQGGRKMAECGNDMRRIIRADLSAEHILKDIKEMDIVADRIQAAVNTTLSLQQSEIANLQAHLSVKQGWEAEKQGRTLMVFTVVTILFLPLSFLSSLFALDVASFQQAPDWAIAVIFCASIAFFIPVTWMAVDSDKVVKLRLWKYVRHPRLVVHRVVDLIFTRPKAASDGGKSGLSTKDSNSSGLPQKNIDTAGTPNMEQGDFRSSELARQNGAGNRSFRKRVLGKLRDEETGCVPVPVQTDERAIPSVIWAESRVSMAGSKRDATDVCLDGCYK